MTKPFENAKDPKGEKTNEEYRRFLLKKSRANCPDSVPVNKDGGQLCIAKTFKPSKELGRTKDFETRVKSAEQQLVMKKQTDKVPWEPLTRKVKVTKINAKGDKVKVSKEINVYSRSPNAKDKGWIVGVAVGTPEKVFKKGQAERKYSLNAFKMKGSMFDLSRQVMQKAYESMSDGKVNGKYNLKEKFKKDVDGRKRRNQVIKQFFDNFEKESDAVKKDPSLTQKERVAKIKDAVLNFKPKFD